MLIVKIIILLFLLWFLVAVLYVLFYWYVAKKENRLNAQMNAELKKIYGDEHTTK